MERKRPEPGDFMVGASYPGAFVKAAAAPPPAPDTEPYEETRRRLDAARKLDEIAATLRAAKVKS
jgi:hypothetical protein